MRNRAVLAVCLAVVALVAGAVVLFAAGGPESFPTYTMVWGTNDGLPYYGQPSGTYAGAVSEVSDLYVAYMGDDCSAVEIAYNYISGSGTYTDAVAILSNQEQISSGVKARCAPTLPIYAVWDRDNNLVWSGDSASWLSAFAIDINRLQVVMTKSVSFNVYPIAINSGIYSGTDYYAQPTGTPTPTPTPGTAPTPTPTVIPGSASGCNPDIWVTTGIDNCDGTFSAQRVGNCDIIDLYFNYTPGVGFAAPPDIVADLNRAPFYYGGCGPNIAMYNMAGQMVWLGNNDYPNAGKSIARYYASSYKDVSITLVSLTRTPRPIVMVDGPNPSCSFPGAYVVLGRDDCAGTFWPQLNGSCVTVDVAFNFDGSSFYGPLVDVTASGNNVLHLSTSCMPGSIWWQTRDQTAGLISQGGSYDSNAHSQVGEYIESSNYTAYSWYTTLSGISGLSAPPTPTPGPVATLGPVYYGTPVAYVAAPDTTAGFSLDPSGSTTCYEIIPAFQRSWTVLGYPVNIDWSHFTVCLKERSFTMGFFGINFIGVFAALMVASSFGILYGILRKG